MPQVHLTLVPSPDPPGSEITETQTDISRISAFLGLLYVIMRAARETTSRFSLSASVTSPSAVPPVPPPTALCAFWSGPSQSGVREVETGRFCRLIYLLLRCEYYYRP